MDVEIGAVDYGEFCLLEIDLHPELTFAKIQYKADTQAIQN